MTPGWGSLRAIPTHPRVEASPRGCRLHSYKVFYTKSGRSGIHKIHFQFYRLLLSNNSKLHHTSNGVDVCLGGMIEKHSLQRSWGHWNGLHWKNHSHQRVQTFCVCVMLFIWGYQDMKASRSWACHLGLSGGSLAVKDSGHDPQFSMEKLSCVSCQQ